MIHMEVKKLNEKAIVPTKAYDDDMGYDFYSYENLLIKPGARCIIDTGIAIQLDFAYRSSLKDDYNLGMIIKGRSGLAAKKGIDMLGGVIDSGYRDSIKMILLNTSNEDFLIEAGDRIGQGVIVLTPIAKIEVVDDFSIPEIARESRGTNGIGSTGR